MGGLQFPGEPKDIVRQLILYHKYENYLRERPDTNETTDIITQIRKNAGFEKQQIRTRDGNYVMSHQPETLWIKQFLSHRGKDSIDSQSEYI